MTCGRIAIILPDQQIIVSTEFNGDMYYPDEEWNGHGKEVIEGLQNVYDEETFQSFIDAFNQKYYQYDTKLVVNITDPEEVGRNRVSNYDSVLDMTHDFNDLDENGQYSLFMDTDYVYIKNLTPNPITITDRKGEKFDLPTLQVGSIDYGCVARDNPENNFVKHAVHTKEQHVSEVITEKKEKSEATPRDDKMTQIQEKLEAGFAAVRESDRFKEYLRTMSRFHSYSANNCMLILRQFPGATMVASYNKWQTDFHRQVQKGERSIQIIAPCKGSKWVDVPKKDAQGNIIKNANNEIILVKEKKSYTYFKPVPVFDISQTSGEPLPKICEDLDFDIDGYDRIFTAIRNISPVPIQFERIDGNAKGYFHSGETSYIVLNEGMSQAQNVKTLIHEVAHASLGHGEQQKGLPRDLKELQAESVAYMVSSYFGIDTASYSFEYLASWAQERNDQEFVQQMEVIRKCADQLIDKIERQLTPELDIQRKENELLYAEQPMFGIYQLNSNPTNLIRCFVSRESLASGSCGVEGLSVDKENYALVGVYPYDNSMSLDDIYTRFQDGKDPGFTGHSLSVSDVIVIQDNGQIQSHYVDDYGFSEMPDYAKKKSQSERFAYLQNEVMLTKRLITMMADSTYADKNEQIEALKSYGAELIEQLGNVPDRQAAIQYNNDRTVMVAAGKEAGSYKVTIINTTDHKTVEQAVIQVPGTEHASAVPDSERFKQLFGELMKNAEKTVFTDYKRAQQSNYAAEHPDKTNRKQTFHKRGR